MENEGREKQERDDEVRSGRNTKQYKGVKDIQTVTDRGRKKRKRRDCNSDNTVEVEREENGRGAGGVRWESEKKGHEAERDEEIRVWLGGRTQDTEQKDA